MSTLKQVYVNLSSSYHRRLFHHLIIFFLKVLINVELVSVPVRPSIIIIMFAIERSQPFQNSWTHTQFKDRLYSDYVQMNTHDMFLWLVLLVY